MTERIQGHVGVSQLDGNAINLGSGTIGTGTQRTVEATDSVLATAATAQGVGCTPFSLIAAGTTEDKTVVKASAGILKSLHVTNVNAAPCYLKLYNKATAPAVASDTPVLVFRVPGGTAGAQLIVPLPPEGIAFSTGIAFVIVTGATVTDGTEVTATEVIVNGSYK